LGNGHFLGNKTNRKKERVVKESPVVPHGRVHNPPFPLGGKESKKSGGGGRKVSFLIFRIQKKTFWRVILKRTPLRRRKGGGKERYQRRNLEKKRTYLNR